MKLVTFLTMANAVSAAALEKGISVLTQEKREPEICRQQERPGLVPARRACIAIGGVFYGVTTCVSGGKAIVDNAIARCKASDGSKLDSASCSLNVLDGAGSLIKGAAEIGAFTLYGIGHFDAVQTIASVVQGIGNLQAGQDPGDAAQKRDWAAVSSSNDNDNNKISMIPPLDTALPMLTIDDVDKNLTFPFHFEHNGQFSTYFPHGFPTLHSMLYTYQVDGSVTPPAVHARGDFPARRDSPHAPSFGLEARQEPMDCKGKASPASSYPNAHFPNLTLANGYGLKFESLATCGHPDRSATQYVNDRNTIYNKALMFQRNQGLAVLEMEFRNLASNTTYSNDRFVIETLEFENCFEGMHENAYCCA